MSRLFSRLLVGACIGLIIGTLHAQTNAPQITHYNLTLAAQNTAWDAESLRALGNWWASIGNSTQALPYWQVVYARTPSVGLGQQIGEFLLLKGAWGDVVAIAQSNLALAADDPWSLAQIGFLLATSHPDLARDALARVRSDSRYEDTALGLLSVLSVPTDSINARSRQIGAVLAEGQWWSHAESAFRYAVVYDAQDAQALAYIALMRDQQGKHSADWMTQALAFAPNDPDVRFVQGLHLRAIGAWEESVVAFQQAIALNGNNQAFYIELAATYEQMGLPDKAQTMREQAQSLSND